VQFKKNHTNKRIEQQTRPGSCWSKQHAAKHITLGVAGSEDSPSPASAPGVPKSNYNDSKCDTVTVTWNIVAAIGLHSKSSSGKRKRKGFEVRNIWLNSAASKAYGAAHLNDIALGAAESLGATAY
jgi:hypothetical protein